MQSTTTTRILIAAFAFLSAWPSFAQLETRGDRDAAGLREQIREQGEAAPSLAELSEAYDRASASWMQVFGSEPFAPAIHASNDARSAMNLAGYASPAVYTVSMYDARGDAAWTEKNYCRAQTNIGSDGASPVSKALGSRGLAFIAAHESAHCIYDQTLASRRGPSISTLRASAPIALTQATFRAAIAMIRQAKEDDAGAALADAYDEALADVLASEALLAYSPRFSEAISYALSLRMGAAFMAARKRTPPPSHLGGYALWKTLLRRSAQPLARPLSMEKASGLALASALIHGLGTPYMPRWAQTLQNADPEGFRHLAASAERAYAPLVASRAKEADEDAYIAASLPAMFVMDLSTTREPTKDLSPEQAYAAWKNFAWISPKPPTKHRAVLPGK